jgi:hypothetical protein
MQCRYCEQKSATRGLRALDVSFHVMSQFGGEAAKAARKRLQIESLQLKLHAHEEQAEVAVDVLVGVQNVGATLEEQSRHARHKALAIGAIDQQNG